MYACTVLPLWRINFFIKDTANRYAIIIIIIIMKMYIVQKYTEKNEK